MNLGPETEQVEHKKSTRELKEGVASIAAILNKHGSGTLYFGVSNDGDVVGQQVADSTLREISQTIAYSIEPPVYPTVERLETEDGKAYVRVLFEGNDAPYACKNVYRIRVADEDRPMEPGKLEAMMLRRAEKTHPWDGRSSGRTVADVDENVLREYVARGVEAKRIPFEFTETNDVLSRLGLLCEDGTLTNAAAVCFTNSEFPMLRMGVLADSARTQILDNQQVAGTLFSMVDAAGLYILNNIRRAFVIDGTSLHRREVPEIPTKAIREALFNAFCHRNYLDGAAVQVDIFWNMVDIYNPGSFAASADPSEYLAGTVSASSPRNNLIAQTLYKSGDIETYGTGLQRIKAACDAQGIPVEVVHVANSVHVRFTRSEAMTAEQGGNFNADAQNVRESARKCAKVRERFSGTLSDNELTVAELMENGASVSVSEVVAQTGFSRRGAQGILNRLIEMKIAVRTGAGRSTRYILSDL